MTPAGIARLKLDEGLRLVAYPDPESPLAKECKRRGLKAEQYRSVPNWQRFSGKPWTNGFGHAHDVEPGETWTQAKADEVLAADILVHEGDLRAKLPWMAQLDPVRCDVLVNIAFNVGVDGLCSWVGTLGHVKAGAFAAAANDLLHEGRWNAQVGKRADRLSAAMLKGSWT